jgi:Domain of unknown function (DUF4270)
VQKRILSIATIALLFSLIFVGCSKLDTTDIGGDLLPAVDNINTFEEILTINTTQGIFNTDSTQVSRTEDHVIGKINNDPLFGTTTANIYAQFKPTFYPYYYSIPKDSFVAFDSVVLCLAYKGGWGDTMNTLLQLQVKEIPYVLNNNGGWDSVTEVKDINFAPAMIGSVIGNATVNIPSLSNYIVYANHKDSVKNQIRIKLSSAFANSLFARDSNVLGNNSFRSDSLYRVFNNGFAIEANGTGNALLYTNFNDAATKLEIHYRKKNGATVDTTYAAFKVSVPNANGVKLSSTANKIVRNRTSFSSPDELYLQTTPGSYANLSIPALSTLSNRIIHRAEIIVEQIPDPVSPLLSAPEFLYLDLKDTGSIDRWKPIYLDLNPSIGYNPDNSSVYSFFTNSGVDLSYFGGFQRDKKDPFGSGMIKYYNFNITRYVQQIVTRRASNYPLRLYAPYNLKYPQYNFVVPYFNRLADGRVKVGGGNNANYKMRLRIVYSKI